MMMSNAEEGPHIHSPKPWTAYTSTQGETTDKTTQFKKQR